MTNALRAKLASFTSPAESDKFLADLWAGFRQSSHYSAVLLAVEEIVRTSEAALLSPGTDATARAFAAGQVAAMRQLQTTFDFATSFDPTRAEYEGTRPADEVPNDETPQI